jgi:hypothetical protein
MYVLIVARSSSDVALHAFRDSLVTTSTGDFTKCDPDRASLSIDLAGIYIFWLQIRALRA